MWSWPAVSTTLPKAQHWTCGAGVGSSTFTCRMRPCQESRPSGMIPFYRWENPNVKGQITLAKRRIPNQTLTFLCKSSGRSVSCNLFGTNDQMRKSSNYCFIFIFLNIFFYLNYLFYLRRWLGQCVNKEELGYILDLPGISQSTLPLSCMSLVTII